jgi:RHS repeat-associated protein
MPRNQFTQELTLPPRSLYANPLRWTGQRFDDAAVLYAFIYRAYSPTLGRWLQHDPLQHADSINLFEYAMSSPLGAVDPLGLQVSAPTVPVQVGTYVATLIGAATATLLAAIQSGNADAICQAILGLESALREAAEILSGFTATAELTAKIVASSATLAAAKLLLLMMADKAAKNITLPSWAAGFYTWAKNNCSRLNPVDCVKKYMEMLGITKDSQMWKDLFTDLVKALSRNPEKWKCK